MAKRTTFYVTTALFEMDISSKAKLVLTYLSRTSNKDGTCYPTIASIARCCGCCKNTVRKALRELERAGIISFTPSYTTSKNGKRRRQAMTVFSHAAAALTPGSGYFLQNSSILLNPGSCRSGRTRHISRNSFRSQLRTVPLAVHP